MKYAAVQRTSTASINYSDIAVRITVRIVIEGRNNPDKTRSSDLSCLLVSYSSSYQLILSPLYCHCLSLSAAKLEKQLWHTLPLSPADLFSIPTISFFFFWGCFTSYNWVDFPLPPQPLGTFSLFKCWPNLVKRSFRDLYQPFVIITGFIELSSVLVSLSLNFFFYESVSVPVYQSCVGHSVLSLSFLFSTVFIFSVSY